MIVDLKKCAERPFEIRREFDLAERFVGHREVETLEPVEAELKIAATGSRRYLVTGRFGVRLTAYCDRCSEPFPMRLEGPIHLLFEPEAPVRAAAHGDGEMDAGEVDVCYYKAEQIELLPLFEEQINLALPMRLLCSEGCRGICQHCGANRNLTNCGCTAPEFDPRLKGLLALKRDTE